MSIIEQNGRLPEEPWTEQEPAFPTEAPTPNPLLKVHQLLRGKYHWAIGLGLVFAAAGTVVTYNLPLFKPKYVSTGYVEIKPVTDTVIYDLPGKSVKDYDRFLEIQVLNFTAPRTLMRAMEIQKDRITALDSSVDGKKGGRLDTWTDKTWSEVKKSWEPLSGDEQLEKFRENLSVNPYGGQALQISFRDPNPELAAVAVKAVIAAYKDIYDQDADKHDELLTVLNRKKAGAISRVEQLNGILKTKLVEFPSLEFFKASLSRKQTNLFDLSDMIGNVESQLKAMAIMSVHESRTLLEQGKIKEADMKLAGVTNVWPQLGPWSVQPPSNDPEQLRREIAEKLDSDTGGASSSLQTMVDLTPELAAATDPEMAELVKNLRNAKIELELAQVRGAPNSPSVMSARDRVALWQSQIDQLLGKVNSRRKSAVANGIDPADSVSATSGKVTLAEGIERLNQMRAQKIQLEGEVRKLSDRQTGIDLAAAELAEAQTDLDATEGMMHKLQFEGASTGRAQVMDPGKVPFRPEKGKRIPATAGATVAGFVAGFALIALFGLFNRRLRTIADARETLEGSKRILGILPALPGDITDPAQMSAVAFAVHHIRTLLQLGSGGTRGNVYAITSAAPQDGKTSLTTALGMSYAASGAKTLLIDADLIGAGLSHRLGGTIRPQIGSILVRKGIISTEQLDAGLQEAKQSGTRLGRVLVKLGFIKPLDKRQALAEQASGTMGILDMLDGRPLSECVIDGGTPNLSIMPVGNIEAAHVGKMSIDAIRRIIAEARKEYDVVIFDTGPLLGSLEAGIVTAAVDEVIVAVARGQQISLLNQTFKRLKELDAKVAGVVFNRAQFEDIERSGYSTSVISQRVQSPRPSANGQIEVAVERRLGPIASALASNPVVEEDQ